MEPNFSRAGNALSMLQDPTLSPTSKSRGFAQIDPSLLLKLPKHTALGGPQVVPRTAGEPEVLLPEEPARQMRDAAQPHVLRTVNAEVLLICVHCAFTVRSTCGCAGSSCTTDPADNEAVYARSKLRGNFAKSCSDDWCALHNQLF